MPIINNLDTNPDPARSKRINRHKAVVSETSNGISRKKIVLAVILLVLVLGGATAFLIGAQKDKNTTSTANKDVAFSINDQDYSIDEYNKVLKRKENKTLGAKEIKNALIEIEKIKYAAKKVEITIALSELNQSAKKNFKISSFNKLTTVQQHSIYKIIIDSKIAQTQGGDFSGYLYVFPFGNTIPQDSAEPVPGEGDANAYDKDQKYARARADYYYEQLRTGKKTNREVLKEVLADNKLRYYNSSNDSVKFETKDNDVWAFQIRSREILNEIGKLNQTGLTDIKTLQIQNTKTYADQDASYYFIDLKKPGNAKGDVGAEYRRELENIKVIINV